MRKIFVAAFAFAGFILTPAIASARPVAVTTIAAPARVSPVLRTAAIKRQVENTLTKAQNDISRGQRMRLVTAREANALRAQIRAVRAELRQSLRRDGLINVREEASLEASLSSLNMRVAVALQPSRRVVASWQGGRR